MAKKPERLPLIVSHSKDIEWCLVPADGYVAKRVRERGYNFGDRIMSILTKPRNPAFNRLTHKLGIMCSENISGFENLDAHQSIKRLQWESGVACDEIGAIVPGIGLTPVRIPKSISFESMDEGEFKEAVIGICRHIAENYWPSLEPEQIAEMADTMPDEV